jgi:hypothetical protein
MERCVEQMILVKDDSIDIWNQYGGYPCSEGGHKVTLYVGQTLYRGDYWAWYCEHCAVDKGWIW